MKNTEKRYMTIKEAMEYAGMGEVTLCEMLRVIDAYPIQPNGEGTRRFIDKTDIDEAFRVLKDQERVKRHTETGRHPF